jgi:peroxiredoxin
MRAPDVEVQISTGEIVPLGNLYENERLALVFLRHLGCVFCRDHVAQLRRLKDLNIAFVTMGTVAQTEAFRDEMDSPHRFICDPERSLHAHFDVRRGGMAQVLHPQVFVRGIGAAMSQGLQKKPETDPLQMPGVFVIDTSGEVLWEHRARHAADNPSGEEIKRRLG